MADRRGSRGNRKRKKNSPKRNKGGSAQNGSSANGNTKSGGRKRSRSKKKQNPIVFWGNAAALPQRTEPIVPADDVHAIVQSLGRAPIPGQEATSEHYFQLVYDRAAGLATALAAAGGLDSMEDTAAVDD